MILLSESQSTQPVTPSIDPGELLKLSQDLAQLVAEGILEAFRDEHNIVRYRPRVRRHALERIS